MARVFDRPEGRYCENRVLISSRCFAVKDTLRGMWPTRSFDRPEESRALGNFCRDDDRVARVLDRPEGKDLESRVLISSRCFAVKYSLR